MPGLFDFYFIAKLFTFSLNQKIDTINVWIFDALVTQPLLQRLGDRFSRCIKLLNVLRLKIFMHSHLPDFEDKRSSTHGAILVHKTATDHTGNTRQWNKLDTPNLPHIHYFHHQSSLRLVQAQMFAPTWQSPLKTSLHLTNNATCSDLEQLRAEF